MTQSICPHTNVVTTIMQMRSAHNWNRNKLKEMKEKADLKDLFLWNLIEAATFRLNHRPFPFSRRKDLIVPISSNHLEARILRSLLNMIHPDIRVTHPVTPSREERQISPFLRFALSENTGISTFARPLPLSMLPKIIARTGRAHVNHYDRIIMGVQDMHVLVTHSIHPMLLTLINHLEGFFEQNELEYMREEADQWVTLYSIGLFPSQKNFERKLDTLKMFFRRLNETWLNLHTLCTQLDDMVKRIPEDVPQNLLQGVDASAICLKNHYQTFYKNMTTLRSLSEQFWCSPKRVVLLTPDHSLLTTLAKYISPQVALYYCPNADSAKLHTDHRSPYEATLAIYHTAKSYLETPFKQHST